MVLLLFAVGTTLTLLGVGLVQAATVRALVEIDARTEVGPLRAYALAFDSARPLLRGLAIAVGMWVVLTLTTVLIPVAVWLAVRWILLPQAVELEGESGVGGLRRSAQLVRHRWLHVASLVGAGALIALAAGPLIGVLLIFATDAPLPLLNVVAGIVYALAMPFVALTTAYVYFDARAREELGTDEQPDVLPAETSLG
jgi:hypothetical protein